MNKHKIVCVIDMQNDFIDGALGSPEAVKIVDKIETYLNSLNENDVVIFTRDTHENDEVSVEIKTLPAHCIKDTHGHEICEKLQNWIKNHKGTLVVDKESFMSLELHRFILASMIKNGWSEEEVEIELFGLCTDICVISNALNLRARFLNTEISILSGLSAGSSNEKHLIALEVMKSNLININ